MHSVNIKENLIKFFPKKFQIPLRFLWKYFNNTLDEEMIAVKKILKHKRCFVDIGSNVGIYSYYYSKIFDRIEVFEPIPEITSSLKALQINNFNLHSVALSDIESSLDLYIPIVEGNAQSNLASLEKRDPPFVTRKVEVKTLDSYDFFGVDLIKIDVEGHEKKIISGAIKTIHNYSPILIVEIEQRHLSFPMNLVFRHIIDLNYKGYFLKNKKFNELENFCYEENQKPYLKNVLDKRYVNNFIFIPNNY